MLIHVFQNILNRHVLKLEGKKVVNLREMILDHRNYLDLNEKTCLRGFRPCKTQTNLLSYRV